MAAKQDLFGRVFQDLIVVGGAGKSPKGLTQWQCRCVCGKTLQALTIVLNSGKKTHCGCKTRENISRSRMAHGQSKRNKTGAYVSWTAMKWRCRTWQLPTALYYRVRGIGFDPRWQKFENFYADMGERPLGLSLDRRDNSKGYSAQNCRWATATEQSQNRRNVKGNK